MWINPVRMHGSTRLPLTELNPHLMCVLCGGYLIDATVSTECLHSFCKTCIIKYTEGCKTCPICDTLIHKTRPTENLRLDKTLQDLVYKLIPGLFEGEMKRRREYYAKSNAPEDVGRSVNQAEARGEVPGPGPCAVHVHDELISVCLQMANRFPPYKNDSTFTNSGKETMKTDCRYLLCPSAVTVNVLQKFIRQKFDIKSGMRVDIFHSDESLSENYTLLDIYALYGWLRRKPFKLFYLVYDPKEVSIPVPYEFPVPQTSAIPPQTAHQSHAHQDHASSEVTETATDGGHKKITLKVKLPKDTGKPVIMDQTVAKKPITLTIKTSGGKHPNGQAVSYISETRESTQSSQKISGDVKCQSCIGGSSSSNSLVDITPPPSDVESGGSRCSTPLSRFDSFTSSSTCLSSPGSDSCEDLEGYSSSSDFCGESSPAKQKLSVTSIDNSDDGGIRIRIRRSSGKDEKGVDCNANTAAVGDHLNDADSSSVGDHLKGANIASVGDRLKEANIASVGDHLKDASISKDTCEVLGVGGDCSVIHSVAGDDNGEDEKTSDSVSVKLTVDTDSEMHSVSDLSAGKRASDSCGGMEEQDAVDTDCVTSVGVAEKEVKCDKDSLSCDDNTVEATSTPSSGDQCPASAEPSRTPCVESECGSAIVKDIDFKQPSSAAILKQSTVQKAPPATCIVLVPSSSLGTSLASAQNRIPAGLRKMPSHKTCKSPASKTTPRNTDAVKRLWSPAKEISLPVLNVPSPYKVMSSLSRTVPVVCNTLAHGASGSRGVTKSPTETPHQSTAAHSVVKPQTKTTFYSRIAPKPAPKGSVKPPTESCVKSPTSRTGTGKTHSVKVVAPKRPLAPRCNSKSLVKPASTSSSTDCGPPSKIPKVVDTKKTVVVPSSSGEVAVHYRESIHSAIPLAPPVIVPSPQHQARSVFSPSFHYPHSPIFSQYQYSPYHHHNSPPQHIPLVYTALSPELPSPPSTSITMATEGPLELTTQSVKDRHRVVVDPASLSSSRRMS